MVGSKFKVRPRAHEPTFTKIIGKKCENLSCFGCRQVLEGIEICGVDIVFPRIARGAASGRLSAGCRKTLGVFFEAGAHAEELCRIPERMRFSYHIEDMLLEEQCHQRLVSV